MEWQIIIVQLQVQGVPIASSGWAGEPPVQCGAALLLAGGGSWAGHWAPEAQQQSAGAVSI